MFAGTVEESELVAVERFEHPGRWRSKGGEPEGFRAGLDAIDVVLGALVDDDTIARRDNVAVPGHGGSVGQLSHKPVGCCSEDEGGLVHGSGFSSDVSDERKRSASGPRGSERQPVEGVLKNPEVAAFDFHPRIFPPAGCAVNGLKMRRGVLS